MLSSTMPKWNKPSSTIFICMHVIQTHTVWLEIDEMAVNFDYYSQHSFAFLPSFSASVCLSFYTLLYSIHFIVVSSHAWHTYMRWYGWAWAWYNNDNGKYFYSFFIIQTTCFHCVNIHGNRLRNHMFWTNLWRQRRVLSIINRFVLLRSTFQRSDGTTSNRIEFNCS